MKLLKMMFAGMVLVTFISACGHSQDSKTFGGSTDTTSSNKAGSPVIRDTAQVTVDEKKAKNDSMSHDTNAKGNARPDGRIK